ncbi:hypothetical protein DP73_21070 [Desulfosporosinus sp. HMP52]|uniref:toll/interleukin-1 receptor domain-containing protein n=1 Tax=Desulfosporosinus sp. HMP52 TaxID=1487923 RepID=UPI00051FF0AD|nr:toll/interleukin-1 receptor domain-containing protein [Desulfosporosinus sp. HMP52]KGK81928.1 hypothetical protein DP73_21070 [Desulfosporosinus sp. HMP52]
MKGINLATQKIQTFSLNEQRDLSAKKCVFLSHRSVDKDKVIKIGDYIMKGGLNIYLDINDANLQLAVTAQNALKITQCIQKGLSFANYVLCLISNNTFDDASWWVPYEIGYADKEKKECCLLKLSTLNKDRIPEYLKIKQVLYNIKDLNNKIESWSTSRIAKLSSNSSYITAKEGLLSESAYNHTLTGIIDKM